MAAVSSTRRDHMESNPRQTTQSQIWGGRRKVNPRCRTTQSQIPGFSDAKSNLSNGGGDKKKEKGETTYLGHLDAVGSDAVRDKIGDVLICFQI
jgi:hypothetical protein